MLALFVFLFLVVVSRETWAYQCGPMRTTTFMERADAAVESEIRASIVAAPAADVLLYWAGYSLNRAETVLVVQRGLDVSVFQFIDLFSFRPMRVASFVHLSKVLVVFDGQSSLYFMRFNDAFDDVRQFTSVSFSFFVQFFLILFSL
jgi:hypothetical protein